MSKKPDTKRCETCTYRSVAENYICCTYILFTGHRRGCEAGANCERYKEGPLRTRSRNFSIPKYRINMWLY